MKLYKGYLLTATDGSEFEIPNTKTSKENFGSITSGRKKRKYKRNKQIKNKHHINKRKTF